MPSRMTTAFLRTVRVLLHERAADYVMWVAGHGADAATVNTYLESLNVFPSHFEEWAGSRGRDSILASLPALRTLAPSLFAKNGSWPLVGSKPAAQHQEDAAAPVPVTKVIETVVTLAIQHHIMTKDQNQTRFTGNGQPTLSGHHTPILELPFLSTLGGGPK